MHVGYSAGSDHFVFAHPHFLIFAYLGAFAWLITLVILALKGQNMERSDRVAQLYGYSVCLIAVVVALISVSTLIDNAFKLSNPLAEHNGYPYYGGAASLQSFEAYKATADQPSPDGTPKTARPRLSDAALRAQYEALRADRLASVQFDATRSLTGALVMLLIAAGLFAFHWRWLRQRAPVSP
jgi:hypothetical protein